MGDLIGALTWARFKNLIRDANDTFGQDTITWRRSTGGLDRYSEDNAAEGFDDIDILGLFNYNYFRTWPMTQTTETGELDRQSCVLILNVRYLEENEWDINSRLNYNPAADRFIFKGITYKAMGDTELAQAQDEPLLFMVILKREEKPTA